MRSMTAILVGFLCVSVMLFAFLARKPLCIDSKLVERFDRVGEGTPVSIYRCGLKKHVPYDGKFAGLSDKISSRLQALEKFLDWIGPLKTKVNLTIFENRNEVYKVYGRELYMSEKILKSPDQLEKSILKVWFRERSHESLSDQMLIEESITDFLLAVMKGHLNLRDPLTEVALDSGPEAQWPRVLQATKSYCQNPWRLTSHIELCSKPNQISNEEAKRISIYSLRPLMTQVMIKAFSSLSTAEQVHLLKVFGNYLSTTQFQSEFASIETETSNYLQSWIKTMKQGSLKQWSYLIESEMIARGFSPEDKGSFIENLVWDESNIPQVEEQIRKQGSNLKISGRPVTLGYIQGTSITILPNDSSIDLKVLSPLKSSRGILVRCGLPETNELLNFERKTQRLLWVDACDQKQDVNFVAYFKSGAENFARNNKEISFIEFHLPSLRMAVQRSPNLRLAQNFFAQGNASMNSSLGWKTPLYVESVQAFRAQSAVEAIDWFRIKAPIRGL